MNYFRTAILLAGLTALFMGVGYLIGGKSGAIIALLVAGAMNFFTYWNSDNAVLSMKDVRREEAQSSVATRASRKRRPRSRRTPCVARG